MILGGNQLIIGGDEFGLSNNVLCIGGDMLFQGAYDDGLRLSVPLSTSLLPVKGNAPATFNRDTGATVTDFEGVIHTAQIDELRFPGVRRIENRVLASQNILEWDSYSTVTDTGETTTAPDGSEVSVFSFPIDAFAYNNLEVIIGTTYCNSIWIKANKVATLGFRRPIGQVQSDSIGVSPIWQRFNSIGEAISTGTAVTFMLDNRESSGYGTDDIEISIWGAQQELVTGSQTGPSESVSTGVESWPYHGAGVDGVKYLTTDREGNSIEDLEGASVEPESTNLLPYSEDFGEWVNNWSGGCTITPAAGTVAGLPAYNLQQVDATVDGIYYLCSLTAGIEYTFSVYAKNVNAEISALRVYDITNEALYTLKITWADGVPSLYSSPAEIYNDKYEHIVDGEYRISFTYLALTDDHAFIISPETAMVTTNSIFATGAQLEAGSVATSYIPTDGAAVNRTATELSYDVTDILTQGRGSLYCEFILYPSDDYEYVFSLDDGTGDNRIIIYYNNSDSLLWFSAFNDSNYIAYSSISVSFDNANKVIITYEDDNIKFFLNGALISSDTSCEIPTNLTTLNVGCGFSQSAQLNGQIKDIKYYNKPLIEAQAIRMTS